uniref:Uncharacterized protein n=1 Tax=Arundo donax TaxID=35708 RepID=A0A0A9ADI6_ARUDO
MTEVQLYRILFCHMEKREIFVLYLTRGNILRYSVSSVEAGDESVPHQLLPWEDVGFRNSVERSEHH